MKRTLSLVLSLIIALSAIFAISGAAVSASSADSTHFFAYAANTLENGYDWMNGTWVHRENANTDGDAYRDANGKNQTVHRIEHTKVADGNFYTWQMVNASAVTDNADGSYQRHPMGDVDYLPAGNYDVDVVIFKTTADFSNMTSYTFDSYEVARNANNAAQYANPIASKTVNFATDAKEDYGTNLYRYSLGQVEVTDGNKKIAIKQTVSAAGTEGTHVHKFMFTPAAAENPLKVDCEMRSGASFRLNNQTGIRFYTVLDTAKIAELKAAGATVEVGTLIAPVDMLGDNELTFDAPEEAFQNVPYLSDEYYTEDDFTGIVGSLVNIKTGNLNREFVGRGYVKVTTNNEIYISYADYTQDDIANNTRTIAWLATQLKNDVDDYNALSADKKAIVDEIAAAYVAS